MSEADESDDVPSVALDGDQVLIRNLAVGGAAVELVRQEVGAGGDAEQVVVRALELGSSILLYGGAMGTVEAVESRVDRLVQALDDRAASIESFGRLADKVSSEKGRAFEEGLGGALDRFARSNLDEFEATGDFRGIGTRKTGDFVIRLNPRDTGGRERRIVIEAKDERRPPSVAAALAELDAAMLNRDAQAAIKVFAARSQAPRHLGPLRHYHGNRIMVIWDPENEPGSELALEVAVELARTLALLASSDDSVLDRALLADRLDNLRHIIERGIEVKRGLRSAQQGLDSADAALSLLQLEAREVLNELHERLAEG